MGPKRQQICGDTPRQAHLVVEDAAGTAAAGEELDLVGDAGAGRVDEVEDGQLVLEWRTP